jgi:amino acid adenylation domain-containing protein
MESFSILKPQENIWNRLNSQTVAYNNYFSLVLKGKIQISYLKEAIGQLSAQNIILNVSFINEDGHIRIKSENKDYTIPFEVISIDQEFNPSIIYPELESEVNTPIHLNFAPLYRVKLFCFPNDLFVLTFVSHKIITDGTSLQIIAKTLGQLYTNQIIGGTSFQPANSLLYKNYQALVQKSYENKEYADSLNTWINDFANFGDPINLPTDNLRKTDINMTGSSSRFEIGNQLFNKVEDFSRKYKTDGSFIFMAAYAAFLYRLSNQDVFQIGFPFNNRNNLLAEDLIGCIDNFLPVKLDFKNSPTFFDLFSQLSLQMEAIKKKQVVPYSEIIKKIAPNSLINPLFQVGFNFEAYNCPEFNGLVVDYLHIGQLESQLDLMFHISKIGNRLYITVAYNTDIFNRETIKHWVCSFEVLLSNLLDNPFLPTDELEILTSDELQQIDRWNRTDKDFEQNICIHHKLEKQAEINSSLIALLWGEKSMTYAALNARANQLAHYLVENIKDGGNQIIALFMDRSPEMMVSIYAILKAGCTYLPLNPSFPPNRIKNILEDAKPWFVLTNDETKDLISPGGYKTISVTDILYKPLHENAQNLNLKISSDSIAYIIYTSGSTGIPKGVMIKHYSVINRISWMQNHNPISEQDVLIQKTPITFDVSIWELFWWSFTGSKLVLLPMGAEKEPDTIVRYIDKYRVTTIHFVPSMFRTFLTYLENTSVRDQLSSLKTIYCSGEALTADVVSGFYNSSGKHGCKARIVNLYGPTEATVDVSYYNCSGEEKISVPIGKPIDNTQLYVVNKSNRLQPFNVPGELLICGVNLAKGYYGNDNLTKEKFIEFDLFGVKKRAYKTGDICFWSEDGNIYYVGRADNQIKLRGMRIELGEIESKILLYPGINYCISLLVNPNTDQGYIAAFYLTNSVNGKINSDEIKGFLTTQLPEYEIPTMYKEINEIPLTPNGKVDRKVLLSYLTPPQQVLINSNNSSEKRIFEIWKRILKNDTISLTSNFFEIGGNSLLLVQLLILLKKEFKKDVDVLVILQYPTIRSLAKYFSDNN